MKKNTKNKISQIDKILMSNKKQNIITAFSMILLAIFAPLKSFVAQWLIDSPSIKAIFVSVLIGAAVVAMSHICEYIVRNTFNRMATRAVSEIRGVLCENLKNMSLSQIHVLPMEDWQSAYTNDLKIVCDDYYFGLFNMAMWGSMGLVAVVYMAVISPALLIVSLVMVCFPFIVQGYLQISLEKQKVSMQSHTIRFAQKSMKCCMVQRLCSHVESIAFYFKRCRGFPMTICKKILT